MNVVRTVVGILTTALLGLGVPAEAATVPGAPDCPVFPGNSYWHADVRSLPKHPRSDAWIRSMGGRRRLLHPDFGPSDDPSEPYGIPFNVEDDTQPKVSIDFTYQDESDPGPYPIDDGSWVENGSDRHVLVVQSDECRLYEVFDFDWSGGDPEAGSGAIWDLRSNAHRPRTWTSADAAGLPILPGLIHRDEVEAGKIDHAIRMTAESTDRRFLWPARHQAGERADRNLPPMGAWFRLKAGFGIARFSPDTRVILRAMRTHGLIVADNGGNWFFGGAANEGDAWTDRVLDELKSIPAGAFVAVDARRMMVSSGSGRVKPRYVGG
jgi:hypothetical protein